MYLENKRYKRYIRGWESFRKNSNAGSTRELMSQVPSQSVIPVVSKGLSLNVKLVNWHCCSLFSSFLSSLGFLCFIIYYYTLSQIKKTFPYKVSFKSLSLPKDKLTPTLP
jgi:hypothetical protein